MPRYNGGFIGTDGLDAPDPPTDVTVSGGIDGVASVSFTAPTDTGTSAITGFVATASDGVGATGTSSPISISGLTLGSAVTFRVLAQNAYGYSAPSDPSSSTTPAAARGVFGGGITGSADGINVMQYIAISTTGNTTDFGNLTAAKRDQNFGSVASSTRGIFASSYGTGIVETIDYITIASTGNASDFGDITSSGNYNWSSFSSSVRGVLTTHVNSYSSAATMEYITIASTGNSTDFGTSSVAGKLGAGFASKTRGCTAQGFSNASPAYTNVIDYVTIASTGNATDFGNMTVGRAQQQTCSSNTRGIIAGGATASTTATNVIDYVTIASTGNATDFGDLTVARFWGSGVSNSTRGVIGGGLAGSTKHDTLDYITIASAGNATDFGNLETATQGISATCNAHGGL